MNRKEALARARNILESSDIKDAPLEGEILLRHVLGTSRAELYTDLDLDLKQAQGKKLEQLLARRRSGEPSAYITGHKEFYGLDFIVNPDVLIPRPDTELLVEKAIEMARSNAIKKIADIGTGCGAIAISLAVHLPQATIYATDIAPAALAVARINCQRHGVCKRVILLHGDLLEPLDEPVDMIVANLPYVRERELRKNTLLRFEPALALNGGKEGLDSIKYLIRQMAKKLEKDGYLLMETGKGQTKAVKDILCRAFPSSDVKIHKDLADIERAVCLRLT